MIYIVPETNFVRIPYKERADYTKFYLNSNFENLERLRRVCNREQEVILAIPELVCRELHQQKCEAYQGVCEQVKGLFNCLGDYGKAEIFLDTEQYGLELSGQIEEFVKNHELTVIPICDKIWFESIVDRAIKKYPPFLGKEKKSDKGFKDTVIWYSLLAFAQNNSGEYIFITGDNIFHDNFKALKQEFLDITGSQIHIYREYDEVAQFMTVKSTERYIDSVSVNSETREIVLKHDDDEFFIKLKYVQPKVFAYEPVLTFINQDIKRIYDNSYTWWDSTDLGSLKDSDCDYEGTLEFEVTHNGGGLLAFRFWGYDYIGGAHGTPMQIGCVYHLSTGKKMTLCDLLGMDEQAVFSLILEKWKEDKQNRGNDVYWDDFEPKYEKIEDVNFYMDDNGIHVFFDVYEAACYADGFVEFGLVEKDKVIALRSYAKG